MRMILVSAVLALAVPCAHSAGFRLNEQDAAANGMGNAFVAVANNASAAWYNPAAMTEQEGTNMSLGTVMIYPGMKHEYTGGSDSIAKKLHIPPSFYITRKMGSGWALGLSVNAPFGLSTEWDSAAAATRFVATLSDIKVVNYNINAAAKLGEKLSIGFGLNYASLDATLNKMVGATRELELEGDGAGMGWNAAVLYKFSEKATFGASYRSPVKIDVDGAAVVTALGLDNSATTKIRLPDTFQFGLAFRSGEKWLWSAAANYTDWATYHKLVIKSNTVLTLTSGATDTSTDAKHWKSVWGFSIGTEHKYSDSLKLRAGAFYDANPVKDRYFETRVPDSDRIAFSAGAGYAMTENLTLDVSYAYLMFAERKVDSATNSLDGKYNSYAHLPGISLGYKF